MKKDKLPANLRGKYVTRAAFAKMQAEKHRLLNDLKTIVMNTNGNGQSVFNKWKQEFKFWKDIQDGLRDIAKRELPLLRKKYPDLGEPKVDSNPKAFK